MGPNFYAVNSEVNKKIFKVFFPIQVYVKLGTPRAGPLFTPGV